MRVRVNISALKIPLPRVIRIMKKMGSYYQMATGLTYLRYRQNVARSFLILPHLSDIKSSTLYRRWSNPPLTHAIRTSVVTYHKVS